MWIRWAAALLRLVLLYGCLCGLLLAAGLQLRTDLAAGRWLPASAPAATTGLPFAGINIDLAAYAPEERSAALSELTASGFGWARQRFDWGALEPTPGVYAWETADAWIDAMTAAGLVPLVVLDGTPAWARAVLDRAPTDNPFAPPADPADLARFAGAFAARYGDRVRYYQVWDEPNIAPHWGNRLIEPVAYAQLLKAAAAAIRAVDPDAVIAAAALAPTGDRGHTAIDEVFFWQRMVAAGAADAFDAVAIQPFGFGDAPAIGAQTSAPAPWRAGVLTCSAEEAGGTPALQSLNFQRAALLHRELAAMGLGDKALWAVRSGWNRQPNSTWGTVTAQDQACYAAAAFAAAWEGWPWLEALGWAGARPAAALGDASWGFALHEPHGAPAPVLAALAAQLPALRRAVRPQPAAANPGALLLPWLLPWLPLAGGLALVAWRSVAAARVVPWPSLIAGWRRLPWPVQALAWGGLLWLYHVAVWPPLIGLCFLLGLLLCLTQPRAGLALAAALLPFYFQHKELRLVDTVLTVPPATAAVLCLLPALLLEARRRHFRLAALDAAALTLLGISLLAAARTWHWQASSRGLLDLVLTPLGLWFAVRVLEGRGGCRRHRIHRPGPHPVADGWRGLLQQTSTTALALFAGGVLVAVWGVRAWLAGEGVAVDGVLRLVGPHFSPNHTALYLVRTLFLGIGLAAAAWAIARPSAVRRRAAWAAGDMRPPMRGAGHQMQVGQIHLPGATHVTLSSSHRPWALTALLVAAVALVLLALVLTGSRGALLLGLPVGALVLGAMALRQQPGLLRWLAMHPLARTLALAGVLAVAVAAVLLWDRLLNRQTLSLRIDLWEASLRLWRDHLLLGVGPGGFFWSYPAYLPLGGASEPNQLHPHNVWLEVATTWGLLGFGWLGLLVWQAAALWQARKPQPPGRAWLLAGLLAALLAAFAHAQMDAFFLLPDLAGWNLLALALVGERVRG